MTIIGIGEILWDVIGAEEHLGGAALNFAAHARKLGHEVLFLTAVGDDERGRRALARVRELDLAPRFIRTVAGQNTGIVTVRLSPEGEPEFTIHRPAAYDFVELSEADLEELSRSKAEWIYFGTLHQMSAAAREARRAILERLSDARRFYDINLRPRSYEPQLVRELLESAHFVKLNEAEAAAIEEMLGMGRHGSVERFCRALAGRFGFEGVCVTRAERGCAVLAGGGYAEVDGYRVKVRDAVGAGDAFAAAFVHGVSEGWPAAEIGDFANRLGALVAGRAGGTPEWRVEELEEVGGPRTPKGPAGPLG